MINIILLIAINFCLVVYNIKHNRNSKIVFDQRKYYVTVFFANTQFHITFQYNIIYTDSSPFKVLICLNDTHTQTCLHAHVLA